VKVFTRQLRAEARQWDGTKENAREIIDWVVENGGEARFYSHVKFSGDYEPAIELERGQDDYTDVTANAWVVAVPLPEDFISWDAYSDDLFSELFFPDLMANESN
jgi:hypothetical protein